MKHLFYLIKALKRYKTYHLLDIYGHLLNILIYLKYLNSVKDYIIYYED